MPENRGILQLIPREEPPAGIAKEGAIAWIGNNPAAANQNFSDNVLRAPVGAEQEQAPHAQIGQSRKIQESVGSSSACAQKLLVIQGELRISRRKHSGDFGDGAHGFGSHPRQQGFGFFFLRRQRGGNDCVGKAVKVAPDGILPAAGEEQRQKRNGEKQIGAPPGGAEEAMI